jgi:phage regulator Rha-like protein
MSANLIPFECNSPLVTVRNNQAVTTSLIVAAYFEKQHKNVLRDITELQGNLHSMQVHQRNFAPVKEQDVNSGLNFVLSNLSDDNFFEGSEYLGENGKFLPMFYMNWKGFSLLAMGFTGEKALNFKVNFINAFERMAEELSPELTPTSPVATALTVKQLAKRWNLSVGALYDWVRTGHGPAPVMLGMRFRYLLEDVLEYEKNGIEHVQRGNIRKKGYAAETAEFISVKTVPKTGSRISSAVLYSAYEEYCREKNLPPDTKNMLGRQLKYLGFMNCRDKTGAKAWRDITLSGVEHD